MEPQYDLRYLRAGLEILKNYLLSDELYWDIGLASPPGSPSYPQLTLGNILFSNARLSNHRLDPDDRQEAEALKARLDEIRHQWSVAWEKKATREYDARLKLWGDYLEEYRKNPSGQADRYAYEVRRRVILDLLLAHGAKVKDQQMSLLKGLDRVLKTVLVGDEFIWDDVYQDSFPAARFWYLYGKPRQK